jgi:polysaccharide pyruvyl transferase WcaK-like protein
MNFDFIRGDQRKRTEVKTITFLGHFGAGNLGNESTLQAVIERTLRHWPQATLQCACTNPKDVESRHKISAFSWKPSPARPLMGRTPASRRWLTALYRIPRRILYELAHITMCIRVLTHSDLLIICGTGVVCDYLTGPSGWPYDLFKWTALAKLCQKDVLVLGVGVGPINHPISRWLIIHALGSANFRSYRDEASKQYMEKIGFNADLDIVCPDVAFGLSENLFRASIALRQRPVIGLGLKGHTGTANNNAYRNYLSVMVGFVRWLWEHGYDVQLLAGDIEYDRNVTEDVVTALKERLVTEGKIAAEQARTVEQLLNQLNATDLVISPRFHNLVLASVLNKPIIALSDHPKLDSLMIGFGLSEYRLSLEALRLDDLIALFVRSWGDAERIKACIREKAGAYREALDEQYATAFALVENPTDPSDRSRRKSVRELASSDTAASSSHYRFSETAGQRDTWTP